MSDKGYLYARISGRHYCATLRPGQTYVLGRGHRADIVIPHPSISRRHCEAVLRPDRSLQITDLGSANGCWVGGESVQQAVVQPGQVFRLGDVDVLFVAHRRPPKRGTTGFLTPTTVVVVPRSRDCAGPRQTVGVTVSDWGAGLEYVRRKLIGGKSLEEVRRFVVRAARVDCPVLVQGETGTGKELVVQCIHRLSRRAHRPLVEVNCGALPPTLLEAELFGHEKGAFTDAVSRRRGVFERADGGSLLLDELGELEETAQVKLLRVLETGKLYRLGGEEPVKVDVRLLAATNRDLTTAVAKGQFRADLYFRINVLHVTLPPLRERKEDIPLLVEHFLRRICNQYGRPALQMSKGAMEKLCQHDWPGNVRELLHCLERAVVQCPDQVILAEHLDFPTLPEITNDSGEEDDWSMSSMTRWLLKQALKRTAGNKSAAARLLGIHRGHFYRLLRRYKVR